MQRIPKEQQGQCNFDLLGNGLCSPQNNILECNFDNGDCCKDHVIYEWPSICQANPFADTCRCRGPDKRKHIDTEGFCSRFAKGDGICNNINNNHYCVYDQGDCCRTYFSPDKPCINAESNWPSGTLFTVRAYRVC